MDVRKKYPLFLVLFLIIENVLYLQAEDFKRFLRYVSDVFEIKSIYLFFRNIWIFCSYVIQDAIIISCSDSYIWFSSQYQLVYCSVLSLRYILPQKLHLLFCILIKMNYYRNQQCSDCSTFCWTSEFTSEFVRILVTFLCLSRSG